MKHSTRSPRLARGLALLLAAVALGGGGVVLSRTGPPGVLPVTNQASKPLPDHALDGGVAWINTRSPIHLKDLRGKIVLLDFWTYCCINCHHILPDLAKLERKYPNELVVIGVHTAKFDAEKDTANIRKKVAEYGIKHPVVNDANQVLWSKFGVNSWPSLVLLDPTGRYVGRLAGEGHYDTLDQAIGTIIEESRKAGTLNETPLRFEPEDEKKHDAPLNYPGKVLADAAGKRLFISDTANNRVVITDLEGKHVATAGNGLPALKDGTFEAASLNRPQGMALVGGTLYVADTENHAIRALDLEAKTVTTIAGTGEQAPFRFEGGPAKTSPLSSPWDLMPDPSNPARLYVAMAGPHQIWTLDLKTGTVAVWAGTGRENIVDGTREEANFAQPSGLATDGKSLFVADSEVSGIRALPFAEDRVDTVVGVNLFGFGDVDGKGDAVRLQHCLGLAYGDGKLFIADTYNNKLKVCDPRARTVTSFLGTTKGGFQDAPALFDEPGGLSIAGGTLYVADTNNHAIRAVDLASKTVKTLELSGVTPPKPPRRPPSFPNATIAKLEPVKVKPGEAFAVEVALALPEGYKLNPDVAMPYLVETPGRSDALGSALPPTGARLDPPQATFTIDVPLAKPAKAGDTIPLKVSVGAFLCRSTLCEIHSYVWEVPVTFAEDGTDKVTLKGEGGKKKP